MDLMPEISRKIDSQCSIFVLLKFGYSLMGFQPCQQSLEASCQLKELLNNAYDQQKSAYFKGRTLHSKS